MTTSTPSVTRPPASETDASRLAPTQPQISGGAGPAVTAGGDASPGAGGPRGLLAGVFDFFCSLKLTVVCLGAALVLVFIGTLAQKDLGLYEAQARYFRSFFIYGSIPGSSLKIPIFPGGYLVGWVLMVNLIGSHLRRFKFNARNVGSWLTHSGVILLLAGQFVTDMFQVESHMRLTEGQTANYSESDRAVELALIDTSHSGFDKVVSVPAARLAKEKAIPLAGLPFTINVKDYVPNSRLALRAPMVDKEPPAASQGLGATLKLTSVPLTTSTDERNVPSAVLDLRGTQGSLGTWLVSPMLEEKQTLKLGNQTYQLAMRFVRYYLPFSLQLLQFRHDVYKGTPVPKNFSSRVRLRNPATHEDREVLIYMNNPLRYGGETFYQSGYDEKDPRMRATILQVVRNPGWLTPYISCSLVALGLTVQFLTHLIGFVRKPKIA